jgi:regulator of protease activity HflC (stomatin/prohibitin superfamily)
MKPILRIALAVVVLVAAAVAAYAVVWRWMICRTYCPIGHSLLVARKTGTPAPRDAYAGEGQQGVLEQLAGPGRHFFNPWTYSVREIEDLFIPAGQIGVVKNNVGRDLPQGRFLAGPDEKGTQKVVLTPGTWRLNLHGQKVQTVGATIIQPGYVGVQTLREGDKKGILDDTLQPGYYNINPREIRVDVLEIGYRVWTAHTQFTTVRGKRVVKPDTGVSFPLADGKEMYLDFAVVWGVFPREAPRIVREYGTITMVESKIIVPQVLSICKNLGSNLTTREFIEGETREKFQNEVTEALQKMGQLKGIHILIALVRGFHPAEDIKETIQARMLAEEEKKTLLIEQETDETAARLEQAEKIVDIAIRDFDAETTALVAGEKEEGTKKAAEIKAQADREVAALKKQEAEVLATALRIEGQAQADVTEALKKADAKKLELLIAAFGGPEAFNLYTFAENLPAELRIRYRYSGAGTLWTDATGGLKDLAAKRLLEYLQGGAVGGARPAGRGATTGGGAE